MELEYRIRKTGYMYHPEYRYKNILLWLTGWHKIYLYYICTSEDAARSVIEQHIRQRNVETIMIPYEKE
ncbi:MAG TPA: hypothetical protein PKI14_01400 [Fervidobacterium sp.]|nr:hypothetical protein [Fervidobacterium sp.]